MKYRFLCAVVALAALSACNQAPQQSGSEPLPVASTASAPSAPSAPSPAAASDTVVLDGVHLNFPNHVRSTKVVTNADGTITHRVDVEYIGLDQKAMVAALGNAFVSKGYTLAGPSERDGVSRYLVMSGQVQKGQLSVAPAGPAVRIKLSDPEAKGVALFVWQEPKSAN